MSRQPRFTLADATRVARGMQRADPLGTLDVVAKHHGVEAIPELFVTGLDGVPLLDEDGVAIWRDGEEEDEP